MKNLFTYLVSLLLLAGPVLAQTTSPVIITGPLQDPGFPDPVATDPVRQKLDNIFANLDKSQVPTRRLAEYATPLISLAHFNGTLRDSAIADMDVFRHIYATALSSRIYLQDTLPSLSTLNQRLAAAAPASATAPIPVALVSLGYSSFRPDAATNGLVTIQNEQVFDVAGRAQSPYQNNTLFAAAPERSYSANSTVALVFRRNLYLSSGEKDNSTLYLTPNLLVDFADGQGYRAVTWGQPISTIYSTGGRKRVRVKASTTSGRFTVSVLESWFILNVAPPTTAARYAADVTYNPGAGFNQIFRATTTYPPAVTDYTHHLGATVNIRYGKGHTSIKELLLLVS